MIRAVVDTNVVVSGFLSPFGPPGRIVEWLRAGEIHAVLDDRILAEYADVLARPAFRLPPAEVEIVLQAIFARASRVTVPPGTSGIVELPDPRDAPFLDCARAEGVPLVTGNQRHFPKSVAHGVEVLTPAEFVQRYGVAFESGK